MDEVRCRNRKLAYLFPIARELLMTSESVFQYGPYVTINNCFMADRDDLGDAKN
jgi:hypothetical protein